MSGTDQHVMRINLRRMELSAFIEVPWAHRSKGGNRAARKTPRRNRQCRPRSRSCKPLAAYRREVRNERIFRFVCLETACDAYVGAWPRRGSSAMALAEDRSVRPIPARATLYARRRPEMARKARLWALEPTPVHNGRLGRRMWRPFFQSAPYSTNYAGSIRHTLGD